MRSNFINFNGIKIIATKDTANKVALSFPERDSIVVITGGPGNLKLILPVDSDVFSAIHVEKLDDSSKIILHDRASITVDKIKEATLLQQNSSVSTIKNMLDSKLILLDKSRSKVTSTGPGSKLNLRMNSTLIIKELDKRSEINLWEKAAYKGENIQGSVNFYKSNVEFDKIIDNLWQKLETSLGNNFSGKIKEAYSFAKDLHNGQYRDNGTPYFAHPLNVALILVNEFNVTDENAIAVALMHDVVEDTNTTLAEVERKFGPEIAKGVDLLSKSYHVSNHKKLEVRYYFDLLRSPKEIQCIKLADRLHNLRELSWVNESKIRRHIKQASRYYVLWAKLVDKQIASKYKEVLKTLKEKLEPSLSLRST